MYDRLILDTCALIWLSIGGGELSAQALNSIKDAQGVYVSSISAFEISLKYKKGGIELPCDPGRWFVDVLDNHDISEIVVDSRVAITSTKLPFLHNDPCDRFIIATAMLNNFTIVTTDRLFEQYNVNVLQ
ncbi:MAG: type II toxin-antitoxin system VapC family toxin [Proteobacteria bacterium]|nr:type II toxin-antitoxin system VapC family toxin [Pseudomonadota bacterium]